MKKSIEYTCSNGEKVTQSTINRRYREAKRHDCMTFLICQCCHNNRSQDIDHTTSQKRCKELHKTELIWLPGNWSYSCRTCHNDFESYKSGKFQYHDNFKERMTFIAIHDYSGFMARVNYVTDPELLEFCKSLEEYKQPF